MIFQPEQIVKYANPQDARETDLRFVVLEDRDTRLYVSQIVDLAEFPYGLTECYAKSEYAAAE